MCQVAFEEKALETAVENAVGSPSLLLFFDLPVPCHVGIWKLSSIKMIEPMNRFRQLQTILKRLELGPWFHTVGLKGFGTGRVLKGGISWTELILLYIYIYIYISFPGWKYIYIYVYATVGWLNAFGEGHHVSGGL